MRAFVVIAVSGRYSFLPMSFALTACAICSACSVLLLDWVRLWCAVHTASLTHVQSAEDVGDEVYS